MNPFHLPNSTLDLTWLGSKALYIDLNYTPVIHDFQLNDIIGLTFILITLINSLKVHY